MKLTDAPASVGEADDPGQPKYAALARRPSVRGIVALWAATVLAAMAGAALTVVASGDLATGNPASNLALAVAAYACGSLRLQSAATRPGGSSCTRASRMMACDFFQVD